MEMIVTKAGHGRRIMRQTRVEGDVVNVRSKRDTKLLQGLKWAEPQAAPAPVPAGRRSAAPRRAAASSSSDPAKPADGAPAPRAPANPAEPAQTTVPPGGSEQPAPKQTPDQGEDPNPGEPSQPTVPAGTGKAVPTIGDEKPAEPPPGTPEPDKTPAPQPRPAAQTPAQRREYARRDMTAET